MKIKSVVKVMNFHSLLRVNASKKRAEKLFEYERELTNFVDGIVNNKNLMLDKKMLKMNENAKELNIYIANDLGFCGNFNSNVGHELKNNTNCDKIVIGKKIMQKDMPDVILSITKEEYDNRTKEIENIILEGLKKKKYSKVNVIYNHYYNISRIELVKRTLMPMEQDILKQKNTSYKEDFVIEGDLNEILLNIITLYLSYEIRIATENSHASENIERQMQTKKSLDKIDEIEEEEKRQENKGRRIRDNRKLLDNIIKRMKKE